MSAVKGTHWTKEKVDRMIYLFFHLGKTAAETAEAIQDDPEAVANRTQVLRRKYAVRIVRINEGGQEKLVAVRLVGKYSNGTVDRSFASKSGWIRRKQLSTKKPASEKPCRGPANIPCLMCSKVFRSRGPGERVCLPCKNTASWHVGY